MNKKNELVIFTTQDGEVKLDVNMAEETVWLNLNQMVELFDRDKSTITRHIKNALKEEVDQESTVAKIATVQSEGNRTVTRDVEYFNLDVIISDGNKRIAATMFLYFLDMNEALYSAGDKVIDDYTLVALTIMIAESRPEEKEMMINVVMNCIR